MRSNPFQPLVNREGLPKKIYTKRTPDDDYIIDFGVQKKIKKLGEKDTDFVIEEAIVETGRCNRQDYINSFRDDVGILNIIEKVRVSGDITLFNQTQRVGYSANGEVDSLGRDLEPVVDVTKYQIDPVDGIEIVKNVQGNYKDGLPEDLVDGLSMEAVANLSNDQIDNYLAKQKEKILAAQAAAKGDN